METQTPTNLPGSGQLAPTDRWHQFQIQVAEVWRQLPNKGLFFLLLVAWLALFQFLGNSTFGYIDTPSLLRWMYNAYANGPDDAHGLLIPLVVLGLFWWKRKQLLAIPLSTWWPAILLVCLGLLLHLIGYTVQQPRISIIGLFVGLYGLMGLAWGRQWLRVSFFPFCLFAFCIPISSLADPITFRLRLLVCHLVEWITHSVLGIEVIRDGTMFKDPTGQYQYEVAAACSGIRSLTAIFALATVYAFVSFPQNWKRVLLLGSAFPLAVLGNLARMLLIILAAEMGGQAAGNYVHESWVFSLVPYLPAIGGLLLLGYFLSRAKGAQPRAGS